MNINQQQQPPVLDLNNLDENYEFRFDYDKQGNLTCIRKVRRNGGCLSAICIFLVIVAVGWWMMGS